MYKKHALSTVQTPVQDPSVVDARKKEVKQALSLILVGLLQV